MIPRHSQTTNVAFTTIIALFPFLHPQSRSATPELIDVDGSRDETLNAPLVLQIRDENEETDSKERMTFNDKKALAQMRRFGKALREKNPTSITMDVSCRPWSFCRAKHLNNFVQKKGISGLVTNLNASDIIAGLLTKEGTYYELEFCHSVSRVCFVVSHHVRFPTYSFLQGLT